MRPCNRPMYHVEEFGVRVKIQRMTTPRHCRWISWNIRSETESLSQENEELRGQIEELKVQVEKTKKAGLKKKRAFHAEKNYN